MTASFRLAQQILQIDATTGALRMLTDDMQDIHGQFQTYPTGEILIGRKENQRINVMAFILNEPTNLLPTGLFDPSTLTHLFRRWQFPGFPFLHAYYGPVQS